MKKIILSLILCIYAGNGLFAQTATDQGGEKLYRGNIALIVREDTYMNGNKQPTKADFSTATYAWVSKLVLEEGFRIVNRDEKAMADVKRLIEENKLEDYLDGFSVQAKGQGADYLLLVDMSTLIENNTSLTLDYSYRLVSVENNIGEHAKTRYEFTLKGEEQLRNDIQQSIADNTYFLSDFLRRFFPVQFGITSAKGRELKLAALQPVGAIYKHNKLWVYSYKNETANYQGNPQEFNVLKLLATAGADDLQMEDGYLIAKVNNTVLSIDNTYACLTEKNTLALTQRAFTTVVGLPYDDATSDGYQKKMVNQAVYCALGRLPQMSLIESDMLPFLKQERELQKTEDFMDGYTVEQLKAVGAQYLIHLSNYASDKEIVSFTLSFLDVASNTIAKTFDCKSHISNLDDAVEYYLKYVFTFPCAVGKIDSKEVELYSMLPIGAEIGDSFTLTFIKTITSPIGGTSYQRAELLSVKYAEYQGMKHRFTVDKVLSKDDMKNVSNLIKTTNFFLLTDDAEPDMMKDNSTLEQGKSGEQSFLKRLSQGVSIQ